MCAMCEPSGPMLKGTTYIVRPRMQPWKRPVERRAHLRRIDPVVRGPGVSFVREQMKVRSSTRATSEGSDHAR